MLPFWYSFVIFLIVLQSNTNAEDSSSISFFNLIPAIIANGRFVQENYIDSPILTDETVPTLNTDLTLYANESNCSAEIQLLARDVLARQIWALKTMDAWGKIPSGLMHGNIYWVGSVYECKHRLRGLNNSVVEQPVKTRTCTIGGGNSAAIRPIYGMCVPQSCSSEDIIALVNRRIIRIPFLSRFLHLSNDSVHCIDKRGLDAMAILTIVFLSILAFLIFAATGLHMIHGHRHDLKMENPLPTSSEPIWARTTTTTATATSTTVITATTVNTDSADEHDRSTESDEATPLIARPRASVDAAAQNLIGCCSLINNYHVLKQKSQPKNLACLNGIRVLSLFWVILGHTIVFAAFYSDNVMTVFNWSRKLWFQIVIQTVFSIDSFFVISGLLTAFLFFLHKNETEPFSILKFILHHYVYRFLRFTPFYAVVLLIYITLSPYLGHGGPMYPTHGIESLTCRRTWWHNLLYINNFFDMKDSCIPASWFLATSMQLHWVAPLFLLAVSWKWLIGMLVAIAFISVDIITTSVIVSKNDYDHALFGDLYANRSNWTSSSHGYFNDVYVKPWCRAAPYAVGLAFGYILFEIYQRSNTLSWESLRPTLTPTPATRYHRLKQVMAWTFALAVLALCVFGTYGDYEGHPLTRSGRITFLTLSRLGWAIGLSVIIGSCFFGRGGLANKFLSWSIFHSLAKLTYGAYLWHSLVIAVNYLGREQPTHYTVANVFFNWIVYIVISYFLSFVTFLFIDLPIVQLIKSTFKRPTNHQ